MRTFIISAIICFVFTMTAQTPHYVIVKGNIGQSGLRYDLENGDRQNGLGLGGEISYRYFFNDNWGWGTGIGFSSFSNTATFDTYSRTSGQYSDSEGDNYTLHLFLYDWEEEQKVSFAEIPLLVSYHKALNNKEKLHLYADAGLKIKLPVSSSYSIKQGVIEKKGYYDEWNVMLSNIPNRFEKQPNYRPSGDIALNTSFAFNADLGLLYDLNEKWSLFGGIMLDYGLNDIKRKSDVLIASNDQNTTVYSGVANSELGSAITNFDLKAEFGVRFHIPAPKPKVAPAPIVETIIEEPVMEEPVIEEPEVVEPAIDTIPAPVVEVTDTVEEVIIPEPVVEVKEEKKTITPITFGLNEFEVSENAKEMLDHFAQMIQEHPEYSYTVVGHTCSLGDSLVNINAGMARAVNFRKALQELGADVSHVKVHSEGENSPLYPNDTRENRTKNRRVEVIVEKP